MQKAKKIKILDTEFKANGFMFKQVNRIADKAIYEKRRIGGKAKSIEVIQIKSHNGYTIAGVYIEPAETYPSHSQWGIYGWTYNDMREAVRKFRSIKVKETPIAPTKTAVRMRSRA